MNDKFLFPLTFEKPCEKKESQGVLDVIKSYTKSVSQKVKNIINPAMSTVLLTSCAHVWDVSQNENNIYENLNFQDTYSQSIEKSTHYTLNIQNDSQLNCYSGDEADSKFESCAWKVDKVGKNNFNLYLNEKFIEQTAKQYFLNQNIYKNYILVNELWGLFGKINIQNLSRENIELLWYYFSVKYLSDVSWSNGASVESWKVLAQLLSMVNEPIIHNSENGMYYTSYNILKQTFEESFVWVEMNQNTINDLYLQLIWYEPGSYEINGYKPSNYEYSTYDIEYFFTAFEENVYSHFENEVGVEEAELLRTDKAQDFIDQYIQKDIMLAQN